jgi:hypothetical protein
MIQIIICMDVYPALLCPLFHDWFPIFTREHLLDVSLWCFSRWQGQLHMEVDQESLINFLSPANGMIGMKVPNLSVKCMLI